MTRTQHCENALHIERLGALSQLQRCVISIADTAAAADEIRRACSRMPSSAQGAPATPSMDAVDAPPWSLHGGGLPPPFALPASGVPTDTLPSSGSSPYAPFLAALTLDEKIAVMLRKGISPSLADLARWDVPSNCRRLLQLVHREAVDTEHREETAPTTGSSSFAAVVDSLDELPAMMGSRQSTQAPPQNEADLRSGPQPAVPPGVVDVLRVGIDQYFTLPTAVEHAGGRTPAAGGGGLLPHSPFMVAPTREAAGLVARDLVSNVQGLSATTSHQRRLTFEETAQRFRQLREERGSRRQIWAASDESLLHLRNAALQNFVILLEVEEGRGRDVVLDARARFVTWVWDAIPQWMAAAKQAEVNRQAAEADLVLQAERLRAEEAIAVQQRLEAQRSKAEVLAALEAEAAAEKQRRRLELERHRRDEEEARLLRQKEIEARRAALEAEEAAIEERRRLEQEAVVADRNNKIAELFRQEQLLEQRIAERQRARQLALEHIEAEEALIAHRAAEREMAAQLALEQLNRQEAALESQIAATRARERSDLQKAEAILAERVRLSDEAARTQARQLEAMEAARRNARQRELDELKRAEEAYTLRLQAANAERLDKASDADAARRRERSELIRFMRENEALLATAAPSTVPAAAQAPPLYVDTNAAELRGYMHPPQGYLPVPPHPPQGYLPVPPQPPGGAAPFASQPQGGFPAPPQYQMRRQ